MMMSILYRIGRFFAIVLPLGCTYRIAEATADIHYRIAWRDRKAVMGNLRIIMGKDADERELHALARQVFRNFAKYLVDFFRFATMDDRFMHTYVSVIGGEHIAAAAARGKGVVFLSAHLGNWELGGSVISYLGYPLTGVALSHRHKKTNDFFTAQRSAGRVRSLEIGASLRAAYTILKSNGFLGLVGDRDFSRTGLPVTFFGRTALIPKGPGAFAHQIGSAIVPVFLIRNGDDTFTLHCEPMILPDTSRPKDDDIADLTGKCARVIETYIRKHPSQWFAFRNIWEEYEKRDLRPHTVL